MVRMDYITFSSLERSKCVLRIRLFMNIMPQKLQNGADMQNLPQCATTVKVMYFEVR